MTIVHLQLQNPLEMRCVCVCLTHTAWCPHCAAKLRIVALCPCRLRPKRPQAVLLTGAQRLQTQPETHPQDLQLRPDHAGQRLQHGAAHGGGHVHTGDRVERCVSSFCLVVVGVFLCLSICLSAVVKKKSLRQYCSN